MVILAPLRWIILPMLWLATSTLFAFPRRRILAEVVILTAMRFAVATVAGFTGDLLAALFVITGC